MDTCIGFAVDCGTLVKGAGVVIMGLIIFVACVYVLLSAVFGRWMGYLVLMVSFSGWIMVLSSLWLFGYWSQGPDTPTNLGPRGAEPAWVVLSATTGETAGTYERFSEYPDTPWYVPSEDNEELTASVQSVGGVVTAYLAEQANEELGREETDPDAVTGTQFTVDSIRFATAEDDKTSLSVVTAHFSSGGPRVTLSLYHDSGSIPRYSFMFLGISALVFLIHLPLLDRAEKKRAEFLTGGAAPAWYGPA